MVIYDKTTKTLVIPDGIEGYTKEDLDKAYQSGYTDGNADGYNDGYSEGLDDGAEEQKALLEPITITENGTYNKEDGYNPVIVDVPTGSTINNQVKSSNPTVNGTYIVTYDSGYTGLERVDINVQVPDRYDDGYDDGFESGHTSGVTDGVAQQKALLSSTTITQNGTYTREDGYSAVTVDVPETILGSLSEGFMTNGERVYEAEEGKAWNRVKISVDVPDRYDDGVNDQKRKLISTAFTENGTYTRADGYSAVTVDVAQTGYTQQDLDNAYDSGYTSGNTDGFASGHTSGVTDGVNQQKALLSSTTITQNGTYTRADGYSAVTVDVPTGDTIHNQVKSVTIRNKTGIEPVTITYDSGYTGLEIVDIVTDGLYDYSDIERAEQAGKDYQLSLLSSITITNNGEYVHPWGYSAVTVNVPQTGYTQQDLDNAYNSGYTSGNTDGFASGHTSGVTDGVNQQKALLSSTTITENGTYTRENGWSAVTVDVSGYTQADLDAAYQRGWNDGYQSGYTDGQAAKYINTPASVELNLSGDTKPVIVASNTDWTATSPDSWITVSPTSGSGNTNIDIIVESGTTNRTGSVVITSSDSSITKTIVVEQTNPADYVSMPLTFEIISGGTIGLKASSTAWTKFIEYKLNDGEWTVYSSATSPNTITVNSGDIVKFRGDNTNYSSGSLSSYNNFTADSGVRLKMYGNIMSLCDSTGYTTVNTVNRNAFFRLFEGLFGLTDASNLVLPATALTENCYAGMFVRCYNLTTAPQLPATTLAIKCYDHMFDSCTSLTTAPELPVTTLANGCYAAMFSGCTSLTTAPELPATTLTTICYDHMFEGCSNLNYIKCLATDISAFNCTDDWVYGVSGTGTFVKAATMENWTTGNDGIPQYWTVQDAS